MTLPISFDATSPQNRPGLSVITFGPGRGRIPPPSRHARAISSGIKHQFVKTEQAGRSLELQ